MQPPTDDYGRIVRLLILTGQRRDEVGGIAETEVLRDLRNWSLPAARTKNGRPHDVPLSDAALALLPAARDDRTTLFGRGEGSFFRMEPMFKTPGQAHCRCFAGRQGHRALSVK